MTGWQVFPFLLPASLSITSYLHFGRHQMNNRLIIIGAQIGGHLKEAVSGQSDQPREERKENEDQTVPHKSSTKRKGTDGTRT